MTKTIIASLGRIRIVTVALFVLALCAGILLPVYTDEVGWRLQERAGFDGVDKLYSDICGPNTLAKPPAFMMPVRYFSALTNGAFATPLTVRLSGILYALVFALLLFLLIRRLAHGVWGEMLTIFAFGLLGLGILPLLLIWSRPDQPLVLALVGSMLIAFWRSRVAATTPITALRSGPDAVGDWFKPFAILALALIALSYHFKALLLIPAFLGAILYAPRSRAWLPRVIPMLLLIAAAWVSKTYWLGRLDCPGDSVVAAQHAAQSLGLQFKTILHDQGPIGAALMLAKNLDITIYARLAGPMVQPMSQWLPEYQIGRPIEIVWHMLLGTSWLLALLLAARSFIVAGLQSWRARMLDPKLVMTVLILAAAFGWCVLQLVHNAYEASFELPVLMIACLFALSAERDPQPSEPVIGLTALLALILPISILAVAVTYGPALARSARAPAYIDKQPFSVPLFHYAEDKAAILATAKLCKITPGKVPTNLLIDDLTYFAFMQNQRPQHYLGVMVPMLRGKMTDPLAYLKSRGSGGIIAGCRNLPPDIRAKAKGDGTFCCLGADDL